MSRHYNIKIDKTVDSFAKGVLILIGELQKLHSWERLRPIYTLKEKGFDAKEIAQMMGLSFQSVYNHSKKYNLGLFKYKLVASEDGLAKLSCKKGGKASLSSLSTKKTSAVERTVAGQTTAVVGQVDRESIVDTRLVSQIGSQSSFERSESDDFIGSAQKQ